MILDQISEKWDGDLSLISTAGRLFAGEVPEFDEDGVEVSLPYTYCEVGSTSFLYYLADTYFESTEVTFHCYTVGMKKAQEAVRKIKDTFAWIDDLNFNDTTSSLFSCRPLNTQVTSQYLRDKSGNPVYRGTLSLLFTINRTDSNA